MNSFFQKLRQIGPGAMVAAAFIGPGTVTTATVAGASYGYTLLWAVVFSILATMILQEMSARLGLVSQMGVGDALRYKAQATWIRTIIFVLVISAILIGNAAYEAGNISGAVLGFDQVPKIGGVNPLVWGIGFLAFVLLYTGKYVWIERTLVSLVALMGFVFIISAILLKPSLYEIFSGLFAIRLPENAGLLVMGLIGTTVVPYNLFLHASAVKQKWSGADHLSTVRWDTILSVALGGLITLCILITAAAAFGEQQKEISSLADLGPQLSPILGAWSADFIAFGFLAAGLTSAITAPLAAAFATSEILGLKKGMKATSFRSVWCFVLGCGVLFSSLGLKPTNVILFAQIANGLLLPIIAIFLVWVMNDDRLLKGYRNYRWQNLIGIFVILVTLGLGLKSIWTGLKSIWEIF